jgi:hypothetical protein
MVCLTIPLWLLALKCCIMLLPSFLRDDASESNCRHSVFQSAKEVLVTSYMILDICNCSQDGFLGVSQLNTKLREMPVLLYFCHVLKLKGGPLYP